jgi:rhodanese-related sulfurtransferase
MAEVAETGIAPERVSELNDPQLVDVRTDAEWEAGRAPGASHVPLDLLGSAVEQLDPERPVVFYCRVGERSAMAAEAFKNAGWDAYSMEGGLVAWAERGLPLEPDGGEVAGHSSLPDF